MNILELDNYNLGDAVKFHDRLNPRLWDDNEHLRTDVRDKLLEIAKDFKEFLGIDNLQVQDITISGSNAAYSYTPHSDIDLHLVADLPEADNSEVFRELFDAKKYQYNDQNNIRIGGMDVELYVQNPNQEHHSQGIYSVLNNKWLSVPRRRRPDVDDVSVRSKYEDIGHRAEQAITQGDKNQIQEMWRRIKEMRKQGLEAQGEFSAENLVFKLLRNNGVIENLKKALQSIRDHELSLAEQNKIKETVRYGYRTESPDGVSPETKMFLSENDTGDIVQEFIKSTAQRLGIRSMPKIFLHDDDVWSKDAHSFGMYVPEKHELHVSLNDRHLLDILRTTAHELCHCAQHEIESLGPNAGDTGSDFENEAHAVAGIIMRDFADAHPEYFAMPPIKEGASGYIPKNKKEARDPRYAMALSVDIKPGQVGKEANKLALNTGRNGEPGLLMKSANLRESRMPQPSQGQGKYRDLNEPLGPEFKPTMPKGTIRVDVSDVYDWYKLGKDIPNLDRAKPSDYGKGPPSTIVSFGDENTEHKYIDHLKKLGLTTTDIDPVDPNQPKGMPRQKVDPTYNVSEASDEEIRNYRKLDNILNKLCGMVVKGQKSGKDYGMVAACVLDPNNNIVAGLNSPGTDGKRVHAERVAIEKYEQKYGEVPQGSMVLTTLSPCNESNDQTAADRAGESCTDYLNSKGIEKVYCGYNDPTQDNDNREFNVMETANKELRAVCKQFADTFLNPSEQLAEALSKEFALFEEQDLFEINMGSKNLRQEAAKTGAVAGMEFEMIVPGVQPEELEPEYERDEGYDRRARNFDDVEEFFYDGDYNGRGDIRRLMESLREAYMEWKMEQTSDAWIEDGLDYMRDYIANNDLFDREEALDQARDEVMTANPDLSPESEDFQQLINARINELEEQFVQDEFDAQGRAYNDAFEQFSEEKNDDYDEGDFLRETSPYMSDVEGTYDIQWPYYTDINDGRDGEMSVDDIADEFSRMIDKPVNSSTRYHGATRQPGKYVVEPDGSLEADSPEDGGLEFVSPPMPIDEMVSDLNKVKAWAKEYGCYTNDSTGLHINISVPNYSLEKLDYVKLALLMGDEYVLELFGRTSNHYAKAATGKIKDMLKRNPEVAPALMEKMRGHMEDFATKAIHSGTTDKYTSINTKSGYIEFRSPGGDWLDANFDKIENTLLRFTVALSAAINPEAYRKEYLKKLYKLLEGSQGKGGVDVINLFANYSAGELDKAALIRQVREKQLVRNVAKGKVTGPLWWNVSNPANTSASINVVANNAEEAIAIAVLPGNYPDWARVQNTLRATPIRPYEEPRPTAGALTVGGRPSNPDGTWILALRGQNPPVPLYRFMAANVDDANYVTNMWDSEHPDQHVEMHYDPDKRYGQPGASAAGTSTSGSGSWGIWMSHAERFARMPGTGNAGPESLRRFSSAEDANRFLTQMRAENPRMRTDVEPREIPADYQMPVSTAAPTPTQSDAAQGGIVDVGSTTTQTAVPGSTADITQQRAAGGFTGAWQVMIDGEEVYRFSGIGNSQADANRVGRDWVLQQITQGTLNPVEGADVEILPIMGDA